MSYTEGEPTDWRDWGRYMYRRHGVTPAQAHEALRDVDALVFDPDYASLSKLSTRTIGWSDTAGRLLNVITLRTDGVSYGVNGWAAHKSDIRRYGRGEDDGRQ